MKVFRGTPNEEKLNYTQRQFASKLGIMDVSAENTDHARDIARDFIVSVMYQGMKLPSDAWGKHDFLTWIKLADDQHNYSDSDLEGEARMLNAGPFSEIND